MTQPSLLPRIALLAGLALAAFQANQAVAQSVTSPSVPGATYYSTPTFRPPVVTTRQPDPTPQVAVPSRNMPDRLLEMRAPVNPVAAQVNVTQQRRAVLNRLENRLTTEPASAPGNTLAKSPNSTQSARQLLESAQPIL